MLNILFVDTSPFSKRLECLINGYDINDLKDNLNNRRCPIEIWDFILDNKLIFEGLDTGVTKYITT